MSSHQDIAMWEKRAFEVGEVVPGPGKQALRILRLLAEGGFSEVHEGACEPSGVHYAVKALRMKHTSNPKTIERALRESTTLYKLRHPHVVPVYFVGMRRADQLIYMVMKLLQGRNLREFQFDLTMAKPGGEGRPWSFAQLPVAWVLEIMRKVCDGLHAVHAEAIHRDLKPENIFLGDDGNVTLIDIGSAKFPKSTRLTTRDMTIGTATYMSPEQIFTPEEMGTQSDLFAIGVILYELLSGALPFQAREDEEDNTRMLGIRIVWHAHTPLKKVAPHLPDYIVYIVERLLRKDPKERYATAREVHDALAMAYAEFIRALGDLAPPPLADVIATIPRALLEAKPPTLPSLATSTNPFITVSMPPDVPRQSALPAAGEPTATADSTSSTGASGAIDASGRDALAFVATEELPMRSLILPPEALDPPESQPEGAAAASVPEPPAVQRAPAPEAVEHETDSTAPTTKALDPDARRQAEALRQMIAELPDELRLAFTLNQIQQKPLSDVAEITGAPEWLVQQRVVEARVRLSAMLAASNSAHAMPSLGAAPGLPACSSAGEVGAPAAGRVGATPSTAPAAPSGSGTGSLATHTREVPTPGEPQPEGRPRHTVLKSIGILLGAAAAVTLATYAGYRIGGHLERAAAPSTTISAAAKPPTIPPPASAAAEPPASVATSATPVPPPASAAMEPPASSGTSPAPVPPPPPATAPPTRPASTATHRAVGAGVRPGPAPKPSPSSSSAVKTAPPSNRMFGLQN
jgi:serine/threonine protein kinase